MSKPNDRLTIVDRIENPVGMFAVMRHSSRLKKAKFFAMHDSYESASAEAIRLVGEYAVSDSSIQHTFYVVELVAFFSAGVEGLRSKEK